MKKLRFYIIALSLVAFLISGCLTVEKKEYSFEFCGPNSGTLTIKYINIMSIKDEEEDVSADDYNKLISDYLKGEEIEKEYPSATNVRKRLFEENGQLCAEVKLDFNDISAVKLFKLDKKSPYMLSIKSVLDSEAYVESNGQYGGEVMPAVFWSRKQKKLTLTTSVTKPDETTVSLLKNYKKNK